MGTKRALLIGINAYSYLQESAVARPLEGCLKDVERMRALLSARQFTDIRILTDETPQKPTRANILAAMESLLEDVAQQADGDPADGDPDVVVFFYAGHGSSVKSQEIEGNQRLGHSFQTLVATDSGRAAFRQGLASYPNRDIFDFEIDAWVRRLNDLQPEPYVTLIFDCCHSAGLSSDRRGGGDSDAVPRALRTDQRPLDELGVEESVLDVLRQGPPSVGDSTSPTRGVAGWRRGVEQRAVVLAACRNDELALGNASLGGFFTFALEKALTRHHGEPRWREIFDPLPGTTLQGLIDQQLVSLDFLPICDKVKGLNSSGQQPVRYGDGPIFKSSKADTYDFADSYPTPTTSPLEKFAVVIGISAYGGSWTDLNSARRDAERVARVLRDQQGYEIIEPSPGTLALTDEAATQAGILRHLEALRATVARRPNSAAVIYFAGHGASLPDDDARNIQGYLVPHGGRRNAPNTWLSMRRLRQALAGRRRQEGESRPVERLESRHLLVILDCCFAGTISFDFMRDGQRLQRPIYASEFRRFVEGQAWQVLTSSAYNQTALDVVRDPRDPRDGGSLNSPFAAALIEGLTTGKADASDPQGRRDRIITVGELHQFIDQRLKVLDLQNPGLAPLSLSNTGQFMFQVPGWEPVADPDPPFIAANNPWPGWDAYGAPSEKDDTEDVADQPSFPFYGREGALLELLASLASQTQGVLVLAGASGSGKTSLAHAGLRPLLHNLVAHRHRVRQWVSRLRQTHLILSPSALARVRQWMHSLDLPSVFDHPTELKRRIDGWMLEERLPVRDGALADATKILSPTVSDLLPDDGGTHHLWVSETHLMELLQRPLDLIFHLRFWHPEPGLMDLLLFEPQAQLTAESTNVPYLLRPWEVVVLQGSTLLRGHTFDDVPLQSLASPPSSESPRLLIIDHCRDLLLSTTARPLLLEALVQLMDSPDQATSAPWRVLLVFDTDVLAWAEQDAALESDLERWLPNLRARLEEDVRSSQQPYRRQVIHLDVPTHAAMRDAIEQPMLDNALIMDSPWVDQLVNSVIDTPAPLALLSSCLHQMFLEHLSTGTSAIDPTQDRQLNADDYYRAGGTCGPLQRRLHTVYGDTSMQASEEAVGASEMLPVSQEERLYFFRLLRRFALTTNPSKDSLSHHQLFQDSANIDPERRWLERAIDLRAVVSDHRGLRLSHPQILESWPAFDAWRQQSPAARFEAILPPLAQTALEWHQQGHRESLLWDDHADLFPLRQVHHELNALERQFLATSQDLWRARLARRLANDALRAPAQRWNFSLLLAAEAVELSLADHGQDSLPLAMENLRRLFAMAPLSVALRLSGPALGLDFDDEGRHVHVRTLQPESASWNADQGQVWEIDLQSLDVELRKVDLTPRVEARPMSSHAADETNFEATDPSGERTAWAIPFSRRIEIEDRRLKSSRQTLRGVAYPPSYLRWSPDGQWLAAVSRPESDAPLGYVSPSPTETTFELRLWRLSPLAPAAPVPALIAASEPRQTTLASPLRAFDDLTFVQSDRWLMTSDASGGMPVFFDPRQAIPHDMDPSRILTDLSSFDLGHWGSRSWPAIGHETPSATWLWATGRQRPDGLQGLDGLQRPDKSAIVALWSLDDRRDVKILSTHRATRQVLTVSRGGRYVITKRRQDIRLWSVDEERQLTKLPTAQSLDISPDERLLALVNRRRLKVFDLKNSGNPITEGSITENPITEDLITEQKLPTNHHPLHLMFDPSGQWLVLQGPEHRDAMTPNIWLWKIDPDHGPASSPYASFTGCRCAIDPSGQHLAIARGDRMRSFRLDANDEQPQSSTVHLLASEPTAMAFSPEGDRLAVGCMDGSVDLLHGDTPTNDDRSDDPRRVERVRRSDDNVQSQGVQHLAFNQAGDRLAVGLGKLPRRPDQSLGDRPLDRSSFFVSPDPEPPPLLVIYDMSPQRLVTMARACAGRVLDAAEWQRHLEPEPYRSADLAAATKSLHTAIAPSSTSDLRAHPFENDPINPSKEIP